MTTKLFTGRIVAGAMACSLLLSPAAETIEAQQTPPLAEVARKEAERRKTIKDAKKVITTKDLPESARKPRTAPTATAEGGTAPSNVAHPSGNQPAGAPAAEGQKPAADSAAKDENYWRGRINTARETLRRNESFAEALQSRINALTTDFVNRDNPIQRAAIGEDRQKALEELARVKSDVEAGRRNIADIEEEARKAGVPPGWLR
jgi:hypothetical protein